MPTLEEITDDIRRGIHAALAVPEDMLRGKPYSSADEVRASIGGSLPIRITYSEYAIEKTSLRNFPVSRHRSARVHKKLLKRFGTEFQMKMVIWRTPMEIIAHPSFKDRIEKALIRESKNEP